MKVGELIKLLKEIDPDKTVLMSIDGEGNSFREFDSVWECVYRDSEYDWDTEVSPEPGDEHASEWAEDGKPAVVFWPQ